MTDEDLKFKAWLEAQPDDRVFTVATCGCPLACYGREVHGMTDPYPGFAHVTERHDWGKKATIPSAEWAVTYMALGFKLERITAKEFRELYAHHQ